ncbi:uncharacterized protein LOC127726687 [Mytilus californianus]|uniref:uncharacterized protein LOC127726687 n=1 Tax=Mytilus californianus TaxID=6549 RepID=UPI0022478C3E|nr:uncharacterized protein LOC127726687 [Mytilus californianus]
MHGKSLHKLSRPISSLTKQIWLQMNNVHSVAATGFNQGNHYDSNRPSYTDQAIRYIVDVLSELSPLNRKDLKYDVLELGAGTGKFTEKITLCISQDVKYLASEPSESFLGVLRNKVPSFVECAPCTADAIPLPNNSVKLIIAAQCFHWFANHENLQELYRVLVPGGRFVMLWNNKDWSIPWVKSIEDILTQYYDEDTPRAVSYKWKHVIESFSGFSLKNHQLLPGIQMRGERDFVVEHFSSISVISRLSPEEKQEALAKFYNVLDSSEMTKHLSEIQIPFHTEIYDVEKMVL